MSAVIEELVAEALGLNVASIGSAVIQRATVNRMAILGFTEHAAYQSLLQRDSSEMSALIDDVVIPETWFFRNPEALTALSQLITHEWRPRHPNRPLRILSAPCSTGEEPYSIAMTLAMSGLTRADVQIDAIDVSHRSLAHARTGVYGRNAFRNESATKHPLHWKRRPEGLEVAPSIREWVNFVHGNLASPTFETPSAEYDVIFCRNVLIYLQSGVQGRAVAALHDLLAPDGYFFVGPAESSMAMERGFHSAGFPMAFAFRKNRTPAPRVRVERNKLHLVNPSLLAPTPPRAFEMDAQRATTAATPKVNALLNLSNGALAMARDLADRGRLKESLSTCQDYLRDHATSAEGWYLLALIHDAMGQLVEAAECYRKTRFLDPTHTDASFHLAHLAQQARYRHTTPTMRKTGS